QADMTEAIRLERRLDLAFEGHRFFDVRRWKVADMAVGDDWIYPKYHRGGEGGPIHGMAFRSDAPAFFEKVVVETRTFLPKHYLFPIPDEDVRRNPKMV
ncbi:RagB/SusD family nutrient uptake outer membrane protein, partial [Klebsiella oxytoca]